MSSRKLGGGRILGNGNCLAPFPLAHQQISESTPPAKQKITFGESVLSPLIENSQDLSSVVSVQNGNTTAVTPVGTQLHCPICNEEMITLLQLNRHLDDSHQELPEIQQDELKTWFNKQVIKAKKFQPLVVINQKLKGLDIFEPNESPIVTISTTTSAKRPVLSELSKLDPDEIVIKSHWQRSGYNDLCTEPSCGKRLGSVNGNVNCRKCGKLFCENHTMYQIKLSRSAQHDPLRGLWCRVCETCYKSRDGYNDHSGAERNQTGDFRTIRTKFVNKKNLETSRLEKRLTKLTQLLADPPDEIFANESVLMQLSGQKNQRKTLEQSIVVWEEDAAVSRCPLCHQEFGSWSFRRHHCRLCGQVVCADPRTGCSSEISLDVMAKKNSGNLTIDIRMCRSCQLIIFSKKDFLNDISHKPSDQLAYENLVELERGIRLLLPKYQRLLMALQNLQIQSSQSQLTEATKVRKRLIDLFGKYDQAAKRIRDLPSKSFTQLKLQKAVYQQSANFLNIHMLPLKSFPKLLKSCSSNHHNTSNSVTSLATIKRDTFDLPSQTSSSSGASLLEVEERELTEQLIALEEQRFMLNEMLSVARKAQRADEQAILSENMTELEIECDRLRDALENLESKSIYL
ncbi:Vacuolar segregation protein pep7 [Erysiphe neolycopersici]|uniref:Vacuolar segregation protein pep7 n=1 Tax=Erysiphe neolycopersici TaxID=212602 RepID=A0A420HRK6_9PEZI|nr:Vacuolar segregation protein pep7 [Erysiphe neolycopersici]